MKGSSQAVAPLAVMVLALGGCGASHEELQQWMEQQRREVKPSVQPLSPPKKFDPQPYLVADAVEPFSSQKLSVAIKQEVRQPNSLLASELNRRKEPLEAYPLDSMNMVGSVNKQGQPVALLRVENLLYQVKTGRPPGSELRKDREDQRDRSGLAGDRSGRGGRMDRTHQHPSTSRTGAVKNMQENHMMGKWRERGLAIALFFGVSLSAWAQNAIQSINSTQQSGAEIVRIELSQPLPAVPTGFSIQAPPRIALDLPGVTNALGRSSVEINQGNLRSVSVAQAGDRTRLVLNLKQPANYRAELQGKVLLVVMEGTGPATATAAPSSDTVRFAENLNRDQLPIRDIDFRRGQDGAGRVVVNLANNQVGVDIKQQGQSLVVEFLRSSLPDNLRRRLDVTDFGTPVQSVSTFQNGDRVRMVVEPRGAWEHSAYQSDNQFVLEVRPQKIDPNKLTQGPGYAGEKLSLNFQNIEVRALAAGDCRFHELQRGDE